MVYKIELKKRFTKRFQETVDYIESEFGTSVAQKFAQLVLRKLNTLQQQPFIGRTSPVYSKVKSVSAGKQNRIYYRIENKKIVILNLYDTRMDPRRNKFE